MIRSNRFSLRLVCCRPFLKRCGSCWLLPGLRKKALDSTPSPQFRQSPVSSANVNVNDRKHIPYRLFAQMFGVEKRGLFRYTLAVVDSRKHSLEVDTSTTVFRPENRALRQEHRGLETWRNQPAGICRRGIVFAASRCAGRDGAGTLRAAALLAVPVVKE